MRFNKIGYYDDCPQLTYKSCSTIWNGRGYLPRAKQTKPKERMPYRKIYGDTSLFYDEEKDFFTIAWTGWTVNAQKNPVHLCRYYKDGRVIVLNILKTHFSTVQEIQHNYHCWGLNRYLSRISEVVGLNYIPRKFINRKTPAHEKTPTPPIVMVKLSANVCITNQKNSTDYVLMSYTNTQQSRLIQGYSNYWNSNGNKRFTDFMRSATLESSGSLAIDKSRAQVVSNYLISQYILNYINVFVQHGITESKFSLHRPMGAVLKDTKYRDNTDINGVTSDTHRNLDGFQALATHPHEKIELEKDKSVVEGHAGRHQFTPSALFGHTYTDSDKDYMCLTSLNEVFGFGIDSFFDKTKNFRPKIHFDYIRMQLGHLHVNAPHSNLQRTTISQYHRGYNNNYVNSEPRGSVDSFQRAVQRFYTHMLQATLSEKSCMWDDSYDYINFPTILLINAALVKAGCNPEHYEFILRQYLGSSAVDWLLKRKEVKFEHPIHKSFLTETFGHKKGRNALKDYIGLISGNSVMHFFPNTSSISCKQYAMEAASGHRALVDGCAYADVIPIYGLDTTEPSLNDYPIKYNDCLYSISRLLTTKTFTNKVFEFVADQFPDGRDFNNRAEIEASTMKYTSLLYDYMKGLATHNKTNLLLPREVVTGFARVLPNGSGSDAVKSYDLNLGLNLNQTFVNEYTTTSFNRELQESLSL